MNLKRKDQYTYKSKNSITGTLKKNNKKQTTNKPKLFRCSQFTPFDLPQNSPSPSATSEKYMNHNRRDAVLLCAYVLFHMWLAKGHKIFSCRAQFPYSAYFKDKNILN